MKYYVSKTDVSIIDGRIQATEIILTRPDNLSATTEMHRRMERIGVPHVAVCKHSPKRYKKLTSEANKRRKKARELTVAEVAEIVAELDKD
tara:strand:+ start:1490 stop:1762 length:273 start_codon:yes stop_codon:yes gene_type:complete